MTELNDTIGRDIARHASEKASKAMRNAISLCDSKTQASMVAFEVLGVIAAQACGVITNHLDMDLGEMESADMLQLMADMMREVKNDR